VAYNAGHAEADKVYVEKAKALVAEELQAAEPDGDAVLSYAESMALRDTTGQAANRTVLHKLYEKRPQMTENYRFNMLWGRLHSDREESADFAVAAESFTKALAVAKAGTREPEMARQGLYRCLMELGRFDEALAAAQAGARDGTDERQKAAWQAVVTGFEATKAVKQKEREARAASVKAAELQNRAAALHARQLKLAAAGEMAESLAVQGEYDQVVDALRQAEVERDRLRMELGQSAGKSDAIRRQLYRNLFAQGKYTEAQAEGQAALAAAAAGSEAQAYWQGLLAGFDAQRQMAELDKQIRTQEAAAREIHSRYYAQMKADQETATVLAEFKTASRTVGASKVARARLELQTTPDASKADMLRHRVYEALFDMGSYDEAKAEAQAALAAGTAEQKPAWQTILDQFDVAKDATIKREDASLSLLYRASYNKLFLDGKFAEAKAEAEAALAALVTDEQKAAWQTTLGGFEVQRQLVDANKQVAALEKTAKELSDRYQELSRGSDREAIHAAQVASEAAAKEVNTAKAARAKLEQQAGRDAARTEQQRQVAYKALFDSGDYDGAKSEAETALAAATTPERQAAWQATLGEFETRKQAAIQKKAQGRDSYHLNRYNTALADGRYTEARAEVQAALAAIEVAELKAQWQTRLDRFDLTQQWLETNGQVTALEKAATELSNQCQELSRGKDREAIHAARTTLAAKTRELNTAKAARARVEMQLASDPARADAARQTLYRALFDLGEYDGAKAEAEAAVATAGPQQAAWQAILTQFEADRNAVVEGAAKDADSYHLNRYNTAIAQGRFADARAEAQAAVAAMGAVEPLRSQWQTRIDGFDLKQQLEEGKKAVDQLQKQARTTHDQYLDLMRNQKPAAEVQAALTAYNTAAAQLATAKVAWYRLQVQAATDVAVADKVQHQIFKVQFFDQKDNAGAKAQAQAALSVSGLPEANRGAWQKIVDGFDAMAEARTKMETLPEQIRPLSAQYRQISATDPEKAKTLLDQINALQAQYQEARKTFEALKTSTGAAL